MRMCLLVVVAAVAALACPPAPVALAQSVYEGFDYDPGLSLSNLNGGVGWSTPWIVADPGGDWLTSSQGLTFPGMASTGGSIVPLDANQNSSARGVLPVGPAMTTYFSYLVRVPEVGTQATMVGMYGNMAGFVSGLVQDGTGDMVFVIGYDPDHVLAPIPYAPNRTYLVTGSLYVDPQAQALLTASVWLEPTAPLSTLYLGVPGDWSDGINAVMLYSTGSSELALDEVYLGPHPNNPAVPEAGTLVSLGTMVGLSAWGLAGRARRRRSS